MLVIYHFHDFLQFVPVNGFTVYRQDHVALLQADFRGRTAGPDGGNHDFRDQAQPGLLAGEDLDGTKGVIVLKRLHAPGICYPFSDIPHPRMFQFDPGQVKLERVPEMAVAPEGKFSGRIIHHHVEALEQFPPDTAVPVAEVWQGLEGFHVREGGLGILQNKITDPDLPDLGAFAIDGPAEAFAEVILIILFGHEQAALLVPEQPERVAAPGIHQQLDLQLLAAFEGDPSLYICLVHIQCNRDGHVLLVAPGPIGGRIVETDEAPAVVYFDHMVPEQVVAYDPVDRDAQGRREIQVLVQHHIEFLTRVDQPFHPEEVAIGAQGVDGVPRTQAADLYFGHVSQLDRVQVGEVEENGLVHPGIQDKAQGRPVHLDRNDHQVVDQLKTDFGGFFRSALQLVVLGP